MIIRLADLKTHLRVDGDSENGIVEAYAEAAEAMLASWIGRPFYGAQSEMPAVGAIGYDRHQMVADAAIRVAVMMLADRMYHYRDGDGVEGLDAVPPMAVQALVAGHRVFRPEPDQPVLQ